MLRRHTGERLPERRPRGRAPPRRIRGGRAALRVAGHDNVFAIGDVSTADAKMAGMARMQADLVAQNIIKMVNGDDDIAAYQPYGPAIVVPIGPEGGSGQLPGQEELASREMVATVKGRDLMVDRFAEMFGPTSSVPS